MTVFSADGIHKSFGGVHALRGVSFDLAAGEVHALVGENGAGKSTLIRIITGADHADAGSLQIAGETVSVDRTSPAAARARGIAAIYQQPALFPDLTVTENIAIAVERPHPWRPIDWRARRLEAARCLDRIGANLNPDRVVRSLSMPEQQLVEIAKAVGAQARIVLMDEPTASLTDREIERLFAVVAALRQAGVAVLYISHRLEEILTIADRITVLRDGTTVVSGPRTRFTKGDLVRFMAGHEDPAPASRGVPTAGDVALEVRHVSNRAAGLHHISLSVRGGEIVGVAGLVGSGRTELAETLFGLRRADSGEVLIGGVPVAIRSPADAMRFGLAYVPEDRRRHGMVAEMSVAANTTLAVLPSVSRAGLIQRDRERAIAERYATSFRVKAPSVDATVGTLSGGNQQKVSLARWLATAPDVLILDEPTQGVDVAAKAEIHGLIRQQVNRGLAVLMISSDMREILDMSDRIVVMVRGRIAAMLSREEASSQRVLGVALGAPPDSDTAETRS
ncbi:MAG TPA: sugar ABC transporter ATP-binding protein [Vicinamibacterales bacterium]|nr:sugar ABC transporter ATP-binding protein [Vicinamibacterales bacterium]